MATFKSVEEYAAAQGISFADLPDIAKKVVRSRFESSKPQSTSILIPLEMTVGEFKAAMRQSTDPEAIVALLNLASIEDSRKVVVHKPRWDEMLKTMSTKVDHQPILDDIREQE